jgi:hypothetical protein
MPPRMAGAGGLRTLVSHQRVKCGMVRMILMPLVLPQSPRVLQGLLAKRREHRRLSR